MTTLGIKQEIFKYTELQFGLTNTNGWFPAMRDTIYKNMQGCVWYVDNIYTCSGNSAAEHYGIVEKVLLRCVEHVLEVNLLKSEWHAYKTIFS